MRSRHLLASIAFAAAGLSLAQTIPHDPAAFTEYVATKLRAEAGDASVVVKAPLTLGLGELQANLDRIFVFCRSGSSACPDEVDRYVKGVVETYKERTSPPSKAMVRVVIRSSQYVQAVEASFGEGGSPQILLRPFVPGLFALPVLDSPRTLRVIGEKAAAELGLSPHEVYDLGLQNVRSALAPLMDVAKVAREGQIGQIEGDVLNPSRLLLVESWAPLVEAQGGTLVVAIPTTDTVFYVGEDTPAAVEALRTLVGRVVARAPNKLSATLLRWRKTGWEVVAP